MVIMMMYIMLVPATHTNGTGMGVRGTCVVVVGTHAVHVVLVCLGSTVLSYLEDDAITPHGDEHDHEHEDEHTCEHDLNDIEDGIDHERISLGY